MRRGVVDFGLMEEGCCNDAPWERPNMSKLGLLLECPMQYEEAHEQSKGMQKVGRVHKHNKVYIGMSSVESI
jgi:hypothetical protein